MLEVRGLQVRYGPVTAVAGLDLEVGAGEVVALLGANGAGKTSTLRAVSGLVDATGEVVFDGRPVHDRAAEDIARAGLVHVPEGRHVFPTLTVHENLLMGTTARSGRQTVFTVDDVYDLFPALEEIRGRGGWALSGGEQQMVAMGRALAASPRMLLLDEPSLGLAPVIARDVFVVLGRVSERVPLLLVEQNLTAALRLCDRAVILAEGHAVLAGTPAELRDREGLLDSYLGRRSGAGGQAG